MNFEKLNAEIFAHHRNSAPSITITEATHQRLSALSADNNNISPRKPEPRKKWSTSTIPVLSSLDESLILGHQATFGTYRQSFDLSGFVDENRSLNTSDSNLSQSSLSGEYEKYATNKNNRRKSWHVGKRRKSSMGVSSVATISPPSGLDRKHGKRGSWWNLLVPDSWPRSRRASTVGISSGGSRHTDNIPYTRNKSRSVDHGFASPFDLDSLRSKVEGRFESVDKLHKDGDTASKENIAGKMQKSSEPIKTTTYTVQPSDTLNSVAARFDTTPSDLAFLNRLTARTVFPGQVIRVPEKAKKRKKTRTTSENKGSSGNEDGEGTEDGDEESGDLESETNESDVSSTHRRLSVNDCESTEECELLESLRPASPKPGHVERVRAPLGASYANRPRHVAPQERFLKINVRHITDGQGVVAGVLLVTPNAVMFDPNVSDTLVIEHGAEAYGVIAPMEFVVNAAIYHDIAHMRVAHIQQKHDPSIKQEIYHLKHRDSISADGGANLYRSGGEKREEDEEEEGKKEEKKGEYTKENTDNVQNSCQVSKPVSQSSEDGAACSCDTASLSSQRGDLVHITSTSTPPNTTHSSTSEDPSTVLDAEQIIRKLEERRQSSLDHPDHHWPVPRSYLEQQREDSQERSEENVDSESIVPSTPHSSPLIKTDCHDSGIDIRDPAPIPVPVTPPVKKSTYSDADILLSDSNDFIPPQPIPTLSSSLDEKKKSALLTHHTLGGGHSGSAVSFAVDETQARDKGEDKSEAKKNKMLKRLSYPLAWMEGFSSDKEDKESLPSSGDSSHPPSSSHSSSVFSKVFSSSPINMVTDLGSGIAGFMKTPSEEGGRFPFPPTSGNSSSSTSSDLQPSSTHLHNLPSTPSAGHHMGSSGELHASAVRTFSGQGTNLSGARAASEKGPSGVGSGSMGSLVNSFSPSSIMNSVGRPSVSTFIRSQHSSHSPQRSVSTSSGGVIGVKDAIMAGKMGPKLNYHSMVSMDDMPELFVSFDIHAPLFPQLEHLELIPRPARSCDDPPLYLRLRMGKPKNRAISRSTPIMSYGKKKMRPEYWFSVPRNRVDELYKFLILWVPHLYGDLDEEKVSQRGFELVDSDTELWDEDGASPERRGSDGEEGEGGLSAQAGELGRESWELPMCDELRRALYSNPSLDLDLFLPDLNGATEIVTEDHRKQLCRHLPARAEGYTWTLVFSTSQHGFSLSSLYRKMNRIDSPILLFIQDTDCNVFGALTSCALKTSDHFYGTGESLLFSFTPELQVYNWTGDNMYFIKGNNESLSIGAGDGKFGLWLDGDLYQGRSEPCSTYGNEPLSPQQDFVVKTLECWAFI
uniref:Oxidation resistance protein 1 n=1 Tax=Cacopsylla melanoneura TaxID=428564 RepID=A0A8D8TXH8_9HEMI